jgi:hypothetical protein
MLTSVTVGNWAAWEEVTSKDDVEPLEVLKAAAMYERYFQKVQSEAVKAARLAGSSWQEIADTVGTTKQTAWQKWRAPSEQGDVLVQVKHFGTFSTRKRAINALSADLGSLLGKKNPGSLRKRDCLPVLERFVDSLSSVDPARKALLVDAAWEGLKEAISHYGETEKVVPFAVYASWWVRQSITAHHRPSR